MRLSRATVWGIFLSSLQLTLWATTKTEAADTVAYADEYLVLKNRQRFIGLRAYNADTDSGSLSYTITSGPSHGDLYGTPPNLYYVPDEDYTGTDSFEFEATDGTNDDDATISITLGDTYELPIGIPEPSFGIEQSHLMYLDTSLKFDYGSGLEPYRTTANGDPYTHYVDFDTGDDTDNPLGSPGSPRATIPSGDLPFGSVIEVHGSQDSFLYSPIVVTSSNGSSSRPMFVRGANATTKAVIKQPMRVEAHHIICENLEFDCSGVDPDDYPTPGVPKYWFEVKEKYLSSSTWETYHHVAIRHCIIHDYPAGIGGGRWAIAVHVRHDGDSPNDSTHRTENVVVYDIEIRDFGDYDNTDGTDDYIAVGFHANAKSGWCLDSHLHHVEGDGVGITRVGALSNQSPGNKIYVARNHVHHCKENAIDIKHGLNSIVSQNKLHRLRHSETSNSDVVRISNDDFTSSWPYSDNNWIVLNEIYDSEKGISHGVNLLNPPSTVDARAYVLGNLVYNIEDLDHEDSFSGGVALQKTGMTQTWFLNNTLFNCVRGLDVPDSFFNDEEPENDTTETVFLNNIISHTPDDGSNDHHLRIANELGDDNLSFDYTCHYQNVRFGIHNGTSIQWYNSLSAFQSSTAFADNSLEDNPDYEDSSTFDLRLSGTSPCIDAGSDDSVYDTFETYFSESIEFDFDGTPLDREAMDIGAFAAD